MLLISCTMSAVGGIAFILLSRSGNMKHLENLSREYIGHGNL